MSVRWAAKDPNEILDYELDWLGTEDEKGRLFGTDDEIALGGASCLWVVPAGLTSVAESHTATVAKIRLSGGLTEDDEYEILNRVTLVSGQVMDQTVKIKMKNK